MMDQIEEPRLLQTLRAQAGEVTCVDAFGARLAVGGGDRSLRLFAWSPGDGWAEAARARAAHRHQLTATRWSPAGALLASAGVDGALRVWCGRTLKARRSLVAPGADAARALCWAGGARLVGAHDDGALRLWLARPALLLATLHAHAGALRAAAVLADALILTACSEGVLKVYDLAEVCQSDEDRPPQPLEWIDNAHDLGVISADASPDGQYAATGGHDSKIRIWRVQINEGGRRGVEAASTLEGHSDSVTALRWAGEWLASGALDRTARLWLPHCGACLHVLRAHARYLTCVAFSSDLRYLLSGSNDKTVRMWSLGSLTLDAELEPPCEPDAHFALGDLEGIGPVDTDKLEDAGELSDSIDDDEPQLLWQGDVHTAPINCIAVHGNLIATASSDGLVKIFRWCEEDRTVVMEHSLEAHEYPAMACDFGVGGSMLLSAGLDGYARVWDVQMGCELRSLRAPGEAGGGGVRGARVSAQRPAQLLLATDDGLAPLWSLADADPKPLHVYAGQEEAMLCCAWSADGRALATGQAGGQLAVRAPPPLARDLCVENNAHEGGVHSCDFAPGSGELGYPDGTYVLVSAGADAMIKLWAVELDEEAMEARMRLMRAVLAHGGGVTCVRWGRGGRLVSAGGDLWTRVWATGAKNGLRVEAALPAGGPAAHSLGPTLLLAAGPSGALALWRLPRRGDAPAEDADPPRLWEGATVVRWLREYVVRVQGAPGALGSEVEAALVRRAQEAAVTGVTLIDTPMNELLAMFGHGDEETEEATDVVKEIRTRLVEELYWLRQLPPPAKLAWSAPHALLCPVSHRLLGASETTYAADGRSYGRAALREWALASPDRGGPPRPWAPAPNYGLTRALRTYLRLQRDE